MRSRTEALNGFGINELPILLTTTPVPRAFIPVSQLLLNPREMPTRATTAAIPTEMPKIVKPVRTGRRVNPRVTTVKNVIATILSRLKADLRQSAHPSFEWFGMLGRQCPYHGSRVLRSCSVQHEAWPRAQESGGRFHCRDCRLVRRPKGPKAH